MRFGDRLSSAVLCCLMVALVFVGPLTDASAQHPEGWPDIVFSKSLGGVFQLYGVMADGSELERLYPWAAGLYSGYPVWSPDHRKIAYMSSFVDRPDGIYRVDVDTGQDSLMVQDPSVALYPAQWSPDGSDLLFVYEIPIEQQVWCVEADGTNPTLLAGASDEGEAYDARWLADGSKVVFVFELFSDHDNVHISSVNPDGTGVTQLTSGTGPYGMPRPSPDGELIAYVYGANIYTMQPNGSTVVPLTSSAGSNTLASDPWSPDGSNILFTSGRDGHSQVYVMNRNGMAQTNLSSNGLDEHAYGWSPDGARIVFRSEDDIWVMNADGSGRLNVSQGVAYDATWRAAGIRRVYLPFLDVTPDADITVPVNVDTCLGVAGMQIELTYDPDILECTGVVKGPLLPGSWAMPSPNIENVVGNVKFLAYDGGAAPLPAGSGEMFTMSFHVKATSPCCTTAPLHFVKCLISDEWGDPILMTPVDGAVTTPIIECSLTIEGTNGSVEVDGTPHALPWTGSVPCGTEVSLLAVPDSGYVFSGWSGDLTTTDNPAYLVVDESKTVTAEFSSTPCSLTILGTNGSVVVDGTPHALPWSGDFTCGTEVTVEAVADSCYAFAGWSGDVTGMVNPVVIAVDGDLIVTASFGLVTYTLSLDKTGQGWVAMDGDGWGLPAVLDVACGSDVWLQAIPQDEHWVFDQWSGDVTGTENPTSLLMDGTKSVTANFLEHIISLSCSATPDIVYSGGTTNLAAIAADNIGHSMTMYWEDMLELDPDPVSAMGTFSPSPYAVNPTYTAPENAGDQDLSIHLQATATCDGDPSLIETASCTLTVKPCAAMTVTPSEGTRGEVARVPVALDLLTSMADRLSFTVAVTPVSGAPALIDSLGFEAAAGLPAPGLVSPTGNQVSVAWMTQMAEPISGSVPLGDILVPVPAGADLGDLYSVCLTVVGASLGGDEICVEAGVCATVFVCVEILAGDCYRYDPPMADGNSDGDTCDWGEYNDDALSWGDVITTFDAWTIPGVFTCGAGSHRYNAMDCYPRDGEPGIGGDGAISWGDIITTFDRWTGVQEIAWRPVCWAGEVEPTSEPRAAASSGRAAMVSETPSIQLADVSGKAGGTLRMPVVLELHGYQADRVGFSLEIAPQAAAGGAPVLSGFEAAAGIPNPMTARTADGGLAVAWMMPIETAVTGSVTLGELIFDLPAAVTEKVSWQVSITAAGASLGESELDAAVSTDDRSTVTVSPAAPHDVGIARFQAPGSVREGSTKTLTIVVENLTETAESVVVRLRRGGEVIRDWSLDLAGKDRQRLRADYQFSSEDMPQVEFTAEVAATADDHPENNTATCKVRVR